MGGVGCLCGMRLICGVGAVEASIKKCGGYGFGTVQPWVPCVLWEFEVCWCALLCQMETFLVFVD